MILAALLRGADLVARRHFTQAQDALDKTDEDPSQMKTALDAAVRGVLDLTFAQVQGTLRLMVRP